jgi:signal transduction histidine kinase
MDTLLLAPFDTRMSAANLAKALFEDRSQLRFLLEPDGTVVDVNETALAVADCERGDVVDVPLSATPLFRGTASEQIETDIERALTERRRVEGAREIRSGSDTRTVRLSVRPIRETESSDPLLLVSGVDVTPEKRRIENLRRQRERETERREEFASVVAHDVRAQLSIASANLELASEGADLPELDDAERALDRIAAILEDVSAVAQHGRSVEDPASLHLGAVAHEAWKHVETADATLDVETSRSLAADESRLQQLFENLFRNSREHGGPAVTVRVGATDDGFYVADDGPGLPEENIDSIFDAGVTTADDGMGFGLSIVESIVHAHDWTIDATNGAGGGARFEVRTAGGVRSAED